ncbi:hypothetical protein TIFTF001_016871 [Ficus carica]|uniref:Uncharacterized protein n=1 Tax=Ficus carica TaxID=3494 RepID=A0AA88ATT2_FICCA|nr:hypothetical protein TIFTF001_016871 [Ficus carica]
MESIEVELTRGDSLSLLWVFVSARDSIMLRRVPNMQCHGRLKYMQKVVAAIVASGNRLKRKAVDLGVGVSRLSRRLSQKKLMIC